MKYLITGITGFVGPHLANLLIKEGHEVVGLVRRYNGMETDILDIVEIKTYEKIRFVVGDIKDLPCMINFFIQEKFDGIFHLAAQSHPSLSFKNPQETMDTNVNGSYNIINTISRIQPNCKLMFCSTSEVYGNSGHYGRKSHEDDKICPSNPYGTSKAMIDLYMQERMNNKYLTGFITRAFSHTGPRRGMNFSISSDAYRLVKMAIYDKKELEVGNLKTTRVVIDVRDVVRAYYLLMINDGSNGKVFNICGDTPREMKFFTDKLIEISGISDVQKVVSDKLYRKNDIDYQHGDTTALCDLTGWKPEIDIDTTLNDLYIYWENKIHRI